MSGSWRIGRLFGITIGIDYSWLIIFGLFTWTLGGSYFPQQFPGWPGWMYWVVGLVTSIVFFASVLAHELGHSVVALARGVRVHSITLFIFGGVARLLDEPDRPVTEFLIAAAGPIVSLGLAVGFGALWLLFGDVNPQFAAFTSYLGLINGLLAVFNLIPGFPLDGGRILRAILWEMTESLEKATRWASYMGQVFAFLLIFVGISQVLTGAFISGLWLAFIGWFLSNAAQTSYQQVVLRERLQDYRVRDVVARSFHAVEANLSLESLVDDYVLRTDDHAFPVVSNGQMAGIICLHDIREVPKDKWTWTTVAEIMTPADQLETVRPDDNLNDALQRLSLRDINQLLVVDNGQLVGVLRRGDVLRFIQFRTDLKL